MKRHPRKTDSGNAACANPSLSRWNSAVKRSMGKHTGSLSCRRWHAKISRRAAAAMQVAARAEHSDEVFIAALSCDHAYGANGRGAVLTCGSGHGRRQHAPTAESSIHHTPWRYGRGRVRDEECTVRTVVVPFPVPTSRGSPSGTVPNHTKSDQIGMN